MAFSFGDSSPNWNTDDCDYDYDYDEPNDYIDSIHNENDLNWDEPDDSEDYDDIEPVNCGAYKRVEDDPYVNCMYCDGSVVQSRLERHLDSRHKCNYCNDSVHMNKETLEAHIKQEHMISCKHCDAKRLADQIAQHELTHSVVGMVQMGILNDERFNQLVAENRIYAKDGCLYAKESDRLANLSQNLVNLDLN